MKGTWQTTGGGGGGVAGPVLAVAALCVAGGYLAQHLAPGLHAGGEFLTGLAELVITVAASVTVAAIGGCVAMWAYRRRHPRKPPPWAGTLRARQLPPARRPADAPATVPPMNALPPARSGGDIHLHLHGLTTDQVAEAMRQAQEHR